MAISKSVTLPPQTLITLYCGDDLYPQAKREFAKLNLPLGVEFFTVQTNTPNQLAARRVNQIAEDSDGDCLAAVYRGLIDRFQTNAWALLVVVPEHSLQAILDFDPKWNLDKEITPFHGMVAGVLENNLPLPPLHFYIKRRQLK